MKIFNLSLVLFLLSTKIFAQSSVASPEELKRFYASTTCVVLDGNMMSQFTSYISEAVKQHWKLTKYEFIDEAEYEKRRTNTAYSFLMKTYGNYDKDKTKARYSFLSLVLGHPGAAASVDNMPDLCSFPLCYLSDAGEEPYLQKLPIIVQFIQNHVELTKNDPSLTKKNILQHYNKASESVSQKTLYLIKDELTAEINTLEKIKKIYPHPVKFVTMDDIETAIDEKDENIVFLHKVGPGKANKNARCWKAILGASDAKLYYFDFHMCSDDPDGLLAKDIKKLKKQ